MIDRQQFGIVMAAFADRIGRPLSPMGAELYYETLSESLDTEQFVAGARAVFKAHTYNTWPAPQLFLDAVRGEVPAIDGAHITRQIEKLSAYSPHAGMIAPNVHQVRESLGDAIADAYATGGGARLFSDNETTREIAGREFQQALAAAVERAMIRGELLKLPAYAQQHHPMRMLPPALKRDALPEQIGELVKRIEKSATAPGETVSA